MDLAVARKRRLHEHVHPGGLAQQEEGLVVDLEVAGAPRDRMLAIDDVHLERARRVVLLAVLLGGARDLREPGGIVRAHAVVEHHQPAAALEVRIEGRPLGRDCRCRRRPYR